MSALALMLYPAQEDATYRYLARDGPQNGIHTMGAMLKLKTECAAGTVVTPLTKRRGQSLSSIMSADQISIASLPRLCT